jgi:hypothetical protein
MRLIEKCKPLRPVLTPSFLYKKLGDIFFDICKLRSFVPIFRDRGVVVCDSKHMIVCELVDLTFWSVISFYTMVCLQKGAAQMCKFDHLTTTERAPPEYSFLLTQSISCNPQSSLGFSEKSPERA